MSSQFVKCVCFVSALACLIALGQAYADDRDQRHGIGPCGVQADGHVGGSGTACADAQSRPARQLPDCLGHESGGALVAGGHHSDVVGGESVEEAQYAFARDGEGDLDTGSGQTLGQDCPDRRGGALALSHRH